MSKVIIVTGAANSIGRSTCKTLAQAGHTVYVSMQETKGHDDHGVEDAGKHGAELRTIAFDVASEASVNSAIDAIVAENNRLDVICTMPDRSSTDRRRPLRRTSLPSSTTPTC